MGPPSVITGTFKCDHYHGGAGRTRFLVPGKSAAVGICSLFRQLLSPNYECAARLNISEQTVKNHVRKVGARDNLTAVRRCELAPLGGPGHLNPAMSFFFTADSCGYVPL